MIDLTANGNYTVVVVVEQQERSRPTLTMEEKVQDAINPFERLREIQQSQCEN